MPPQRHSRNPLESKHGVIRNIFVKLRTAEPDESEELQAYRAVSISNDLYGNYMMSSFELSKGYTKPLVTESTASVPSNIVEAHEKLKSKRKLALLLRRYD